MKTILIKLKREDVLKENYDAAKYYQQQNDEKGGYDLKLLGRKAVASLIMNLMKEKIMDDKG
ncbi:MAG: hypothetical protein PHV05_07455 [Candidatus Riflebacteria bacterium]|nr:hypothetical protein [Candidatus Riflebacteria bacterium]